MPLAKGAHAYVTGDNETCYFSMIGFWRLPWSIPPSPSIGAKNGPRSTFCLSATTLQICHVKMASFSFRLQQMAHSRISLSIQRLH